MTESWTAGLTPAKVQVLRGGFDDDAEVYQRTRPVCPLELFDDLMRLARLSPGDRVLEIAPGTGQATVVAGCQWARPTVAHPFWAEVQDDYQAVGFRGSPPPPPAEIQPWRFPPQAESGFDEAASLRYPFQKTYSAEGYLAQLATQAGTRKLGPEKAAEFLDLVRHRLDVHGWPSLTRPQRPN